MKAMKLTITLFVTLFISVAASAEDFEVIIENFAFTPSELVVAPGDSVTFTNLDAVPHSVVRGADTEVDFEESGILRTDEFYSLKIEDSGIYDVKCGVHPGMPGVRIISESKEIALINEIRSKLDSLEALVESK